MRNLRFNWKMYVFPRKISLRAYVFISSSYSKNDQAMSFFGIFIFTYFFLYFIIARMFAEIILNAPKSVLNERFSFLFVPRGEA